MTVRFAHDSKVTLLRLSFMLLLVMKVIVSIIIFIVSLLALITVIKVKNN